MKDSDPSLEPVPGAHWTANGTRFSLRSVNATTVEAVIAIYLARCQVGAVPVRVFLPTHIFLAAAISFILAAIPFFDRKAKSALETIKPSLTIEEEKYVELSDQLTTLPAFKSILASIVTLVIVYCTELLGGGTYYIEALVGYPISMVFSRARSTSSRNWAD